MPLPKNIYGVTKVAAEDLCELFWRQRGLPCVVLRTSRFFPENDDDGMRDRFHDANVKVNELLYRRVDVQDVVDAHLLAVGHAARIGFGRYIISATSPFGPNDTPTLRTDMHSVVTRYVPEFAAEYTRRRWTLFQGIDRVYINLKARTELGWQPRHDFSAAIRSLPAGEDHRSPLAIAIGSKRYHSIDFATSGLYPVA